MVSHWSLSVSKSSQSSRNLLSILADLNNAVVRTVSIRPLISKSSCPFTHPLLTVPRVPITIGITVTLMYHNFFKVEVLILLFVFFQFHTVVGRDSKVHKSASSFFFVVDYHEVWSSGRLLLLLLLLLVFRRCTWCNGYRRRKWTRRNEFKSWTRLIAFHIVLIPSGKVWIQLFSLQLWVNSRTD